MGRKVGRKIGKKVSKPVISQTQAKGNPKLRQGGEEGVDRHFAVIS